MIENRGNQFQQKNIFLLVETIFDFFANASYRAVETDFLASTNHKLFFRLVETYFFNESLIPAVAFYWKLSALLESFFLLAKTVTDMRGKHFLKTDLVLVSEFIF